jgi:lysozyme
MDTPVEFPLADFSKDMDREEGFRLRYYKDTVGLWTIGRGHLIGNDESLKAWKALHGATMSKAALEKLFREDVAEAVADLDRVTPWWRTLSPVRQCVMASMTFQLGGGWLKGPKAWPFTLGLIRDGSYSAAATQMKMSLWAKQTPNRAARMCHMMKANNREFPKP